MNINQGFNSFKEFLSNHDYVLWDWNGTLLDDRASCVSIINDILKENGYQGLTEEKYLDIFTIPVVEYYEKLGLDQSKHSFKEIGEQFISKYNEARKYSKMFPNMKELVKSLNPKVKQILFSAAHTSELDFQIAHHKLEGVFNDVSGAGDFTAGSKLERGKIIVDKYSNKGEGLIVGDTLHDMAVGKEIGLTTVWISGGHQPIEKISGQSAVDFIFDREFNTFNKNI